MYIYRLLYINLMVTTNKKKSKIDMYPQERKESKYNTKDNHQITRDKSKNGDGEKKELQKTIETT